MKKSYFRRRNVLLSASARLALIGACVLLVLVLLVRFIFPGFFFAVASPFFFTGTALTESVSGLFSGFSNASLIAERNKELRRENAELTAQNLTLTARLEDFEQLTGEEPLDEDVLAGVIARPPLAPYDTFIVALPEGKDSTVGALVLAKGGVPVGTVETIVGLRAQVSLFSTPGRTTDAWVGAERLPLTLYGQGGGAFIAETAREAEIVVGDIVYGSGPGALPMGTVIRIDSDPSLPRATLRIQPSVNLFSLSTVLIRVLP